MTRLLRVLIAAFALFGTVSVGIAGDPACTARIRILSYNIHHGAGVDGRLDLSRIAKVISSVSPDVVSLQEVDRKTRRTGEVDQAEELGRLTGMKALFGASMPYDGGEYGNVVLTKFKVLASKCAPLPGEPRGALCVTLEVPSKTTPRETFSFIATHLDTARAPRLASPPLIERRLAEFLKGPAILAGDLNAVPDSPTMRAFWKSWQNATDDAAFFTIPVNKPARQIDYVLYRPANRWRVVETRVLEEPTASDHRPVSAVVELITR